MSSRQPPLKPDSSRRAHAKGPTRFAYAYGPHGVTRNDWEFVSLR
jgi:hypothetical protein